MSCVIHSSNSSYLALYWCAIYTAMASFASIFSTILIAVYPPARPPMPDAKPTEKVVNRPKSRSNSVSSITSVGTIESTTSTLVDETSVHDLPKVETPICSKLSHRVSVPFMHTTVALPSAKSIARPMRPFVRRLTSSSQIVTQSVKQNVVVPTSKVAAQIIPASKASPHKCATKIASLSRKSVRATKKMVGRA